MSRASSINRRASLSSPRSRQSSAARWVALPRLARSSGAEQEVSCRRTSAASTSEQHRLCTLVILPLGCFQPRLSQFRPARDGERGRQSGPQHDGELPGEVVKPRGGGGTYGRGAVAVFPLGPVDRRVVVGELYSTRHRVCSPTIVTSGRGPAFSEAVTASAGRTRIRSPNSARCRSECNSHCGYGDRGSQTTRTRWKAVPRRSSSRATARRVSRRFSRSRRAACQSPRRSASGCRSPVPRSAGPAPASMSRSRGSPARVRRSRGSTTRRTAGRPGRAEGREERVQASGMSGFAALSRLPGITTNRSVAPRDTPCGRRR